MSETVENKAPITRDSSVRVTYVMLKNVFKLADDNVARVILDLTPLREVDSNGYDFQIEVNNIHGEPQKFFVDRLDIEPLPA